MHPFEKNHKNKGVNYFYQNRKFYFLINSESRDQSTVVLSTKSLFQIEDIGLDEKMIFDTDSIFHFMGWVNGNRVISKKHNIEEVATNYRLYEIEKYATNQILISFTRFATEEERSSGKQKFYFTKTSNYDVIADRITDFIVENK